MTFPCILDKEFKYVPSTKTNIRKTFDRIRKEQKEATKVQTTQTTQPNNIIFNKKETALGIYQIRPGYFKDSRVKGNHEQVFNPAFARSVCEAYFKRYEPAAFASGDFETLARLHNNGPSWAKSKSKTNQYWNKIQKNLK